MISDPVYFYYFLIHIPITVLMDATFVIPEHYQISLQRTLSAFHIEQNKDFLAIESPLWMKIFVVWELVFQLPFFMYAVLDYLKNGRNTYSAHTWPMFFLYGFNAGFTTLVCLIYIIAEGHLHHLSTPQFLNLLGLYTPTMVLPFYMMYDFWLRICHRLTEGHGKSKLH